MPSNKQRLSITITDPLQKTLDVLWVYYPHLEGYLLESIQFMMIYAAEAIPRDRSHSHIRIEPSPTVETIPTTKVQEPEETNIDDEWA